MRWAKFCINSTWLGTALVVLCGLATAQQVLDLDGHAVDPFSADATGMLRANLQAK